MNRILIIGQGNIGTFIGAALQTPGNEITHYVRDLSKARNKVTLQFNDRRKTLKIKKGSEYTYSILHDLNEIAAFDFIIIPVAHHQWKQVIKNLQPYVHERHTMVLAGNIWNDFNWLEQNIKGPYIFAFPNFGGAIINKKVKGWLTPFFTTGITNSKYKFRLQEFNSILQNAGFTPKYEKNIIGWLKTHFASNAAMMTEAARQNGFQTMTRKWGSLLDMYRLQRECLWVVKQQGVDIMDFAEGRKAYQPLWWNALITYLIFHLPGLTKDADSNKKLKEWSSYGKSIYDSARKLQLNTPLLKSYEDLFAEL